MYAIFNGILLSLIFIIYLKKTEKNNRMKQRYILFALVVMLFDLSAQNKTQVQPFPFLMENQAPQIKFDNEKAAGDTLFLFDGYYFSGIGFSLSGATPFHYSLQDLDQLTLSSRYTGAGYPAKAAFLIDHQVIAPADTNFFLEGISDFTPPGTANDWMSFGPIKIPAAGATLSWKHNYPDSDFRDGYKVYVNTVGLGAANFTVTPVYTVADNDVSTKSDTLNSPLFVFYPRSTSLSAYAGQSIYLGIQHSSVNQDRVLIDDILIKEYSPTGIEVNNTNETITIYPNPSTGLFTINMGATSKTHIEVYDVMGEIVYSKDNIATTTSIDLTDLSAGVYSLKVISADNKIAVKEVLITKQ